MNIQSLKENNLVKSGWALALIVGGLVVFFSDPTLTSLQYGLVLGGLGFLLRWILLSWGEASLLRFVRFPVVFSYFLILLGITVATRSVYLLTIFFAINAYTSTRWARSKDEQLLQTIGSRYALYMASVPGFFPRLPGASDKEFSGYLQQKKQQMSSPRSSNFFAYDYPFIGKQILVWGILMGALYLRNNVTI